MTPMPKFVQDKIANEMYEAAVKDRDNKKSRNYLGMSEIGKPCGRAIWYNFRGYTPVEKEGRILMIFDAGDLHEQNVIKYLKLAGYKVEGQQGHFSDHNGLFSGHCDGIIHGVTSRPHILEVKSAKDAIFKKIKKNGVKKTYPVYFCQCQCYMGYSGLERALVVVQNKNTSEIYTERIYFFKQIFEQLRQRAKDIISLNEPPDKLEGNDFECNWCDHRINCQYPESIIVKNQTCGTCYYFGFKGLDPMCRHPKHNLKIERWGESCPDWVKFDTKEEIEKKRLPL